MFELHLILNLFNNSHQWRIQGGAWGSDPPIGIIIFCFCLEYLICTIM